MMLKLHERAPPISADAEDNNPDSEADPALNAPPTADTPPINADPAVNNPSTPIAFAVKSPPTTDKEIVKASISSRAPVICDN